ncbi:desi1 [Symbiodinium microadriaticum]|nr:desi1 [Symbiodinium microadriaticum]
MSIIVFAILASIYAVYSQDETEIYDCSICIFSDEYARENQQPLHKACLSLFNDDIMCSKFATSEITYDSQQSARSECESLGYCKVNKKQQWRGTKSRNAESDNLLDIRISKAYGSKGYDQVRVSVISNESITSDLFTYSEQFKYRWTYNVLNTGMLTVEPGKNTEITIAGQTFNIRIPEENSPIRGVVVADPCFSNDYVWCSYGDDFDTFNRSTLLLNAIHAHDDSDFWMVLGDNFYDQTGEITAEWFAALSPETKSRVYGSVPGNHDFWILSAPRVWMPQQDQLGNGFMQFNAQDVAASAADPTSPIPYDFSSNPDAEDGDAENLPPAADFFWYYKLGNIGLVGYSGGHSYSSMRTYFEESCSYMAASDVSAVLLMGHWNSPGLGCPSEMNVPATYRQIVEDIPACKSIEDKLKYMMGHEHCNKVVEKDVGFMVAGQGMTASAPCGGNYGLPVVDTHNGTFTVYFFDIAQLNEYDNFDDIYDCIVQSGVSNCYHLATVWSDVPLISHM